MYNVQSREHFPSTPHPPQSCHLAIHRKNFFLYKHLHMGTNHLWKFDTNPSCSTRFGGAGFWTYLITDRLILIRTFFYAWTHSIKNTTNIFTAMIKKKKRNNGMFYLPQPSPRNFQHPLPLCSRYIKHSLLHF